MAYPHPLNTSHHLTLDQGHYHPSVMMGDGRGWTELPWHAPLLSLSISSQKPTD